MPSSLIPSAEAGGLLLVEYQTITTESRLDWLTGTIGLEGRRAEARDVAAELLSAAAKRGDEPKQQHWQGYAGLGTKHIFFGNRPDGSLIRLSEVSADEGLTPLAPLLTHISRLDCCLTLDTEEDRAAIIREALELARASPRRWGTPSDTKLIDHSRKGLTAYFGSRTSARYGRVYDKSRECDTHGYAHALRYECEFKGVLGPRAADRLAASVDRRGDVDSIVRGEFARWNVPCRGQPLRSGVHLEYQRPPTDTDRRLRWLAVEVRRTVAKLLEAGKRDEVMHALGLSPDEQPQLEATLRVLDLHSLAAEPRVNPVDRGPQ